MDLCTAAVKKDRKNYKAYTHLGDALISLGRYKKAVRAYPGCARSTRSGQRKLSRRVKFRVASSGRFARRPPHGYGEVFFRRRLFDGVCFLPRPISLASFDRCAE